jgi:Glycosyl hydrolase family 1
LLERILDPIILGDYPSEMRKILGSDLPRFTSEERNLLMRTKVDFIGINHYSTVYVKDCILSQCVLNSFEGNGLLATTGEKDGNLIGNPVNKKNQFVSFSLIAFLGQASEFYIRTKGYNIKARRIKKKKENTMPNKLKSIN